MKNLRNFKLQSMINAPDSITFLNLLCGVSSIIFSMNSMFREAALAILLAALFDYLDGKTASMLRMKTDFGKELDSIADVVSFGVAPFVFGLSYIEYDAFLLISSAFFVICGAARLARYNIMNYKQGFLGMPITMNSFIFPLIYFLALPDIVYPIAYALAGFLMVSSIRFRRLS